MSAWVYSVSRAMNSLARSEDQGVALIAESMAMDLTAPHDKGTVWSDRRGSSTLHNGLPVRWRGGRPIETVASTSRSLQLSVKRVFDVVMASLALIALMPLLVIVSLCIAFTSKGPVLFRQHREGLDGQSFEAFKFRSMKTEECDVSGITQTTKDDPRITRIGKFIRKTSIDELPQLINVLRGDMSLVGPRPHVAGMKAAGVSYRALVPYYDERLVMRPGITGWAQANSLRGSTEDAISARARVDHDIAYIQNFSLLLDIKIILLTVQREFLRGSGD